MSAASVHEMAERVADLLEARLNIGGKTLADKLRRGGRRLHRRIRREADYLAQAAGLAEVPRLLGQIDPVRTQHAYDACLRYLRPIGGGERRRTFAMQVLTGMGLGVFATGLMVVLVLVWRGYL